MRKIVLGLAAITGLSVLLSACGQPETPQTTTERFWQAVIENDIDDVVGYSTLTDTRAYDDYARDWSRVTPVLGKVVIDGNEAMIVTALDGVTRAGQESADKATQVVTYLVIEDERWLVDYTRTGEAFDDRNPFQRIVGTLEDLGQKFEDLGQKFKARLLGESSAAEARMREMAEQLAELSESEAQRTEHALNQAAGQFQDYLDELADAIEQALEEEQGATVQDKQVMANAVTTLNAQSRRLSDASLQAIAASSQTLAETQQRLNELNQAVFAKYRKEWQPWAERFEQDLTKMLNTLSEDLAENKADSTPH